MLLNNASFTEIRSLRSPFASIGMPESADAPANPYLPAEQKAKIGYAEASVFAFLKMWIDCNSTVTVHSLSAVTHD